MTERRSSLLLTRPMPQSRSFLADCETLAGRRIDAVISPVIEILPVDVLPDMSSAATVVITSQNAVRVLGDRLANRSVVTVGTATAELACTFGAQAVALGETADELLTRSSDIGPPALVARGVHARLDLAAALTERGVEASAAVVYDQVARPLSDAALALLSGNVTVVAPVFSPRSAALLSANPITAPLVVIAMSTAVRDAWRGPGEVIMAERPTAACMASGAVDNL